MKKVLLSLVIMLPFYCFGSKLNITLSKNSLDLSTKDSIIYKFYLPSSAITSIKFINIYGGEEIEFETGKDRAKGWHEVKLHSDSLKKKFSRLSSGLYYVEVSANNDGQEAINFNSFQAPWGDLIAIPDPIFNETSGDITYEMPEFGMVRLRIGIKNAALFRSFNWNPQTPKNVIAHWDGMDQTGTTKVLGKIPASVSVSSFSLPKTCFILQANDKPINYSAELIFPETANKLVISQQARLPWSNNYDLGLDLKVELTDSENVKVNFPNFIKNKAITNNLEGGINEFYLTIDGDFMIETDGIELEQGYSIAIPKLDKGLHHFIVNLVFGPEYEPNTFIGIGIKEINVK